MTSPQNHDHLIHLHGGGGRNFVSSSSSSSSSFRFPGPDEEFVPNWIRAFKGINTHPFRGVPEIKKEEGRFVVTYKGVYRSPDGKPIEVVEYLPLDTIPSIPSIERDLGLLNLSSSSSDSSSLLPPAQFPFPWVVDMDTGTDDDGHVKILSVDEITSKLGIMEIRGEVECTNCHQTSTIGFDLKTESIDIGQYVFCCSRGGFFRDNRWLNPNLTPCPNCSSSSSSSHAAAAAHQGRGLLKPVIPENDDDIKKINWLFLFLGEMLGCCSVQQLNLFCKHNTSDCRYRKFCGAKDRLLYLAYLTFCNYLYPIGPFNDSYLYLY